MPKFRPVLIHFDYEGYNRESKRAEEKKALFIEAVNWMESRGVNLLGDESLKSIHKNMLGFFTDYIWQSNKAKIQLEIPKEKLLNLLDIDTSELSYIQANYESYSLEPKFNGDEGIQFEIDKAPFERYTKSADENRKLRDFRTFVEALEKLSEHCHIYPHKISSATSSFVGYDLRKGEFYPMI